MSETVIISKTSPRQRPQPREPTAATVVGSTICSVGDTGRLEKLGSKSKSTASLVMVKELVHRDNSRLVKDLMALLAIREATKEATTVPNGTQSNEGDAPVELRKDDILLHKNRPGDTTVMLIPTMQDEEAEQGGTKPAGATGPAAATMTAAAVASLLHHTATKEFSSLAGEIIAIADDTPTANSNEDEPLDGMGMVGTAGAGDDEMMLHADAAAPELNTSENSTDEAATDKREDGLPARRKDRPLHQDTKGEVVSVGTRYELLKVKKVEQRAKTDALEMGGNLPQRPNVEWTLQSGPVPVSFPSHSADGGGVLCGPERTATPIPTFGPSYICRGLVSPTETERPAALTLEQKLDKLLDSVVKIKADMHRRIDRLGKRVEQIHLDVQLNIDSTDRALLRNDLLLIGIPHREREDLQQCFRAVCRALEYTEQDIPQVDIRRQRVPGGSRRIAGAVPSRGGQNLGDSPVGRTEAEPIAPAPIVLEFMFKTLRDQFYRAYQAKRVLRLSDIGFSSDRRFFVNEVLTKYNQKLMAEAVRRKRLGLLHSVYTVDGIVYVQRVAGEKGTKVTSFSSLN